MRAGEERIPSDVNCGGGKGGGGVKVRNVGGKEVAWDEIEDRGWGGGGILN